MRSLFEKTIQEAILDLIGRSDSGADLPVKKVLGNLIPASCRFTLLFFLLFILFKQAFKLIQ